MFSWLGENETLKLLAPYCKILQAAYPWKIQKSTIDFSLEKTSSNIHVTNYFLSQQKVTSTYFLYSFIRFANCTRFRVSPVVIGDHARSLAARQCL